MNNNQHTHPITIDFEPLGKRVEFHPGETLADSALRAGIDLITSCNGLGVCTSCKIELVHGELTSPTENELARLSKLKDNHNLRLACQCSPLSDVRIFIPPGSLTQGQQLQVDGHYHPTRLSTHFFAHVVNLTPPTLEDLRGDWERLQQAYFARYHTELVASLDVIKDIPISIRTSNWQVKLIVRRFPQYDELISIISPDDSYYGLAFDIGSTKIAAFLINLENGEVTDQTGFMNPQIALGEDVVNRISHALQTADNARKLQDILVGRIAQYVLEISRKYKLVAGQLVDMVVVGNTAIHHLFCGLPIKSLGEAPYVPAIQSSLVFSARQHNIPIAPGANIYLPPNIAGYVGADHTAAVLATRLRESDKTVCLIDIGTNTEISLIHHGKIMACSCASGPAFEGAHIQDGMRAAPGAIDQVSIENDQIQISTIGQKPATGICGSGILSVMAEMRRNRIIDRRGVFNREHVLVNAKEKFLVLNHNEESPVRTSTKCN